MIPRIKAIFDNEGETFDRYTVINSEGDMFGYSETAAGFDQYCGNCVDNVMFHEYGYAWRKYCDVKKVIKGKLTAIIEDFQIGSNIGKLLKKEEYPKVIVNAYKTRMKAS